MFGHYTASCKNQKDEKWYFSFVNLIIGDGLIIKVKTNISLCVQKKKCK
jgi:hypothetical protein